MQHIKVQLFRNFLKFCWTICIYDRSWNIFCSNIKYILELELSKLSMFYSEYFEVKFSYIIQTADYIVSDFRISSSANSICKFNLGSNYSSSGNFFLLYGNPKEVDQNMTVNVSDNFG